MSCREYSKTQSICMSWCSYNSSCSTFLMRWYELLWNTTNDNSILRKLETDFLNARSIYSRESSERDSKCRSILKFCLIYNVWSFFEFHLLQLIQSFRRLRLNSYTSKCCSNSHLLYQKKKLKQKSRFDIEIFRAFEHVVLAISAYQIRYFEYFLR
jgi:hypothetical protein